MPAARGPGLPADTPKIGCRINPLVTLASIFYCDRSPLTRWRPVWTILGT
jgi:hypothetical protein